MCDISTLAKYKNRPSPPRPANDLPCRNKVFIGNDGMYWKSTQASNGIYRWVKTQSSLKSPARKPKSPVRKPYVRKPYVRKPYVRKPSIRKSPARKPKPPTALTKTVSVTLTYKHTNEDIKRKPTKKELDDFYRNNGAFEEAKNLLTGYYGFINYYPHAEELQKRMNNFKLLKNGIITFKVPSRFSNELIEKVVEITEPDSDGAWEGDPGKDMVFGENGVEYGVIAFKNVKIY